MSEQRKIIHDDNNGLDYVLVGDYYMPMLALPEENRPIGYWGILRKQYLKKHKSGMYSYLLLTGKLDRYLADLNEQAQEWYELIEAQMRIFANEDIEIPPFTDEIRNLLLEKASADFDWSEISPTIFGAVFESTLNPETRRSGGMHYTSIENIHKVIDPLFLDDLKNELKEIQQITVQRTKDKKLRDFQMKLANLRWLDPASGSGNFLTETYISIRRLENEVIKELQSH